MDVIDYLTMLGLKLNNVNKGAPGANWVIIGSGNALPSIRKSSLYIIQ